MYNVIISIRTNSISPFAANKYVSIFLRGNKSTRSYLATYGERIIMSSWVLFKREIFFDNIKNWNSRILLSDSRRNKSYNYVQHHHITGYYAQQQYNPGKCVLNNDVIWAWWVVTAIAAMTQPTSSETKTGTMIVHRKWGQKNGYWKPCRAVELRFVFI